MKLQMQPKANSVPTGLHYPCFFACAVVLFHIDKVSSGQVKSAQSRGLFGVPVQ